MGWLDSIGSALADIGSQAGPALARQYGGPVAGIAADAAMQALKSGSVKGALPAVVQLAAQAPQLMTQGAMPSGIPPGALAQLSALLPLLLQRSAPGMSALVPNLSTGVVQSPLSGGFDLGALLQGAAQMR